MNSPEDLRLWYQFSWVAMISMLVCAIMLVVLVSHVSRLIDIATGIRERLSQPVHQQVAAASNIEAEIQARAEMLAKEEVKKILAQEKLSREAAAAFQATPPAPAPRAAAPRPTSPQAVTTKPQPSAPAPQAPRPAPPPKP